MNTPDKWDENPVEAISDSLAEQNIDDGSLAAALPGQNVFAKEFVPSFGFGPGPPAQVDPASVSTSLENVEIEKQEDPSAVAPQPANPDHDGHAAIPKEILPPGLNANRGDGPIVDIEKMDDEDGGTWSDKASEEGSMADETGTDVDSESAAGTSVPVKPKKQVKKTSAQTRRKDHLNIIFIGHVDAGKSTIGGHIMYLTGQVDKRTLEKYEKEAKEKNRESWYLSWALDTNVEERDKGKTVEVGRAFFETDNKHFTILDAPGHKSFVPNMIGGASQADIAVLVISARKGEFETGFEKGGQTREHAMLVKTAGVKHIIIVVNKMDDPTVEWDASRFAEIKDKLTPYLKKCGFNPKTDMHYIPVSGLTGVNLKDLSVDLCTWYEGPSLIQYLDALPPISRRIDGPVRLPIVDRYKDMGTIVLGKLESGCINKGQILALMPNKCSVEVMQLWSDDDETDQVFPGESIKIKLKNVEEEDVSQGFVLCSPDNLCHTAKIFDAQIAILEYKSIMCAGYSAVMHLHTCVEEVTISALICLVDKKTNEKSKTRPRFLKQDQCAIVRLEVSGGMICIEPFEKFNPLGRFTLRDEGRTVAMGKVLKIVA